MKIIEAIALLQRITNAVKNDIEAGDKYKALSKMEILEGELQIFREGFEPKEDEGNSEAKPMNEPVFTPPVNNSTTEVIDSEATEIVE